MTNRRQFLQYASAAAAATTLATKSSVAFAAASEAPFKISLAEWSLHKMLFDKSKNVTNLDFPKIAKEECGIDAVEYVNQFFKDKANDKKYLGELKQRCDGPGSQESADHV